MKPLVIYHDNCADGFGAAFAAWMKFGDEAEYLPMQYGGNGTAYETADREVYILDFSFPREIMDSIFANANRVVWLDHHKTAFEMWCGKSPDIFFTKYEPTPGTKHNKENYILLDDCKSGAMLAWEYFHPDTKVPVLIRCIDDYDRWQFKLEGSKEVNKALWSYAPWTFEQWRKFLPIGDLDNLGKLKQEGAAILRAHDQNVQAIVKGAARQCSIVPALIESAESYKTPWTWWVDPEFGDTCGVKGLAANCPPHLASDVGLELANQSGTFGLLWYINKDGKCLCSLRSNGDYDVSAIAKAFGGGGHKNAAGFEVEITTLLGWIK